MDAANHLIAARRARWAVAALFLGNGFMVGSWAPHIPLLVGRLDISAGVLGILIFFFGVGALVSMPFAGWLMSRFGQKPVLRFFALAQGLGLLFVELSPVVPVVALAMAFFGASVGCTDVAMNASTVTVERRLGKAVMSSMHGFWSLGGFAGGALGGVLIKMVGVLPHAVIVAVLVVGVGFAIRPLFIETDERPAAAASDEPRKARFPRQPILYVLGILALFCFVSEGVVLDWAALYMTRELGSDVAVAGLAYAFFAGAMALMRFAGDGVRNRFGAVATMRGSALVAGLAMLAASLAPTPWLVIAAFAICGLGVANTVPIIFSAAGNQPGVSSAVGMSVATTMGYAGILLAPGSIGFVGDHVGFAPVFAAMALLLFVVFLASPLTRAADSDHNTARQ
ncbi:MAG: MFS transporter [Methylobacterium mesophilicum]|nr:MFS transporter [Methylobacterium mesophilicum]